jgi:signal transduction histidine kinase
MPAGEWLARHRGAGHRHGHPADQLPHIFSRFWQADTSSQRKFQGMGIGLALVKELAEVQGGSVSADSEVGKGTTMTVKLPLAATETPVTEDEAVS